MTARHLIISALTLATLILGARSANAHCQIPCGIYGDQMKIDQMLQDLETVEKAMKQIPEFAEKGNWNQVVRWTHNKEQHAQSIQQEVLDYWLAQRVKLPGKASEEAHQAYHHKLAVLHGIVVHAMKAKQTTDTAHIEALRSHIEKFSELYFDKDKHKHLKEHHRDEGAEKSKR